MKKLISHSILFFLSFTLLSCEGGISKGTPIQEPVKSTQTAPIPETNTPVINSSGTMTPEIVVADINFLSKLSGSLFVGSYDSGEYIELDFDNGLASRFHLPKHCELLSIRLTAVCETDYLSDKAGIYIYDVPTEQLDFTEPDDVGRWNITSSEQLLAYTRLGSDGIGISLEAFNFIANTHLNIGTFDTQESMLSIPQLSNSVQTLIGVNYKGLSWDTDDEWYVMSVRTMQDEPIAAPENIAATESIEWSPNDALVLLVGFYRNDEIPHVGVLRCGKEALIYDAASKVVTLRVKAPEGRCYDPFFLHPRNIWSPDSAKFALVLDQQDICIVDVSKNRSDCFLVTNYDQTEYYIARLAWSPDSKFVAYISGAGEIQVYSLEDNKTYLITKTDDLSSSPIGSELVWGQ